MGCSHRVTATNSHEPGVICVHCGEGVVSKSPMKLLYDAATAWERADAALQAHYVEHGDRPPRLVNTLDKATTNLRTAILAAQPPQETTTDETR